MAKTVDQAVQEHLGVLVMQAIVLNARVEELTEKVKELEAKLEGPKLEVVGNSRGAEKD